MNQEWVIITDGVERLDVPGGWLYRVQTPLMEGGEEVQALNVVFVPLPERKR